MGNLGWTEMIFIAVVALMVFGPKRLPEMGRKLGRIMGQLRQASDQFKQIWDSEVEKANLKEITDLPKTIQNDLSPNNLLNNTFNTVEPVITDNNSSAEPTNQISSTEPIIDSPATPHSDEVTEPNLININPPSGDTIERSKPSFDVTVPSVSSTPETISQTEEAQPVSLTKN